MSNTASLHLKCLGKFRLNRINTAGLQRLNRIDSAGSHDIHTFRINTGLGEDLYKRLMVSSSQCTGGYRFAGKLGDIGDLV